jgi:hypothetical protein
MLFPSQENEQVASSGLAKIALIILNPRGKEVFSITIDPNSLQLNVSSWARGVYVCRLNNSSEAVKLIAR